MDIKVGEYFRTKNGEIAKVLGDEENRITTENYEIYFKEEIVDHSFNIIDLIEVGDILKIKEDNSIFCVGLEKDEETITYQEIIDKIKNNEIKLLSIVTKEQFKTVGYEV